MVIFGHSYLLVNMSRAAAAHSSPRRKLGLVLSLGWVEKRADMAQTERIRTGGKAPALDNVELIMLATMENWNHGCYVL